jgi:hypothetical protein
MPAYRTGRRFGKVKNDDADLIQPRGGGATPAAFRKAEAERVHRL